MIAQRLMTVAALHEFANLPENASRRFELIDGEVIEMASASRINGAIASLIQHYLWAFVLARQSGYVTGPNTGYQVGELSFLQPDAAYIRSERAQGLSEVGFETAPDIAVEVISPSETASDVFEKTRRYFAGGTSIVWNVYADKRIVHACKPLADGRFSVEIVNEAGALDGGDVLHGFPLALKDVFAALPV